MNSVLKKYLDRGQLLEFESMKKHTSFRIGGSSNLFFKPNDFDQLIEIVGYCSETGSPFKIVGNGTNLLVSDFGFQGAIISTLNIQNEYSIRGTRISASSAMPISKLSRIASENELTGLEWACGIPGTVGGAVFQNAGAFGESIENCVSKVMTVSDYCLKSFSNKECEFAERYSIFQKNKNIILDASFHLRNGSKTEILQRMKNFAEKRKTSQPKGFNAGSIFKNTTGFSAGFLIEHCGLKGKTKGGAEISKDHANFIINNGNATANDVKYLMKLMQKEVYNHFGISLKPEIEYIGEDNENIW